VWGAGGWFRRVGSERRRKKKKEREYLEALLEPELPPCPENDEHGFLLKGRGRVDIDPTILVFEKKNRPS